MEELLAYAYLMGEGFDLEKMYEDLLELEFLSSNLKESIIYIKTHINYKDLDINKFGFWMYSVWEGLAGNLQDKEPFFTLCYADDPLSWGDEKQSREIYEKMLSYYDE